MIDTLHPLPQGQQFLGGLDRLGKVVRCFEICDPLLQLRRLLCFVAIEQAFVRGFLR